jgi:hypothetical protein
MDLALRVLDSTTNSIGDMVWWENVQCWGQTATGQASMPYCELRAAQSPAQFLVTGLLGDLPAPATVLLGTQLASWPQGSSLSLLLGRRGQVSANAQLVGAGFNFYGSGAVTTPSLDATAYNGYTISATVTSGGWNPRGFSSKPSDLLGTYHLWNRFKSAQSAGNLPNVMQRAAILVQSDAWLGIVTGPNAGGDLLGSTYASRVAVLTASNTWTLCDAGQVAVPPFPAGALQDLTQNYVTPRPQVEGLTGGGSTCTMNWELLLPVDGSRLAGIANNPSNNPYAVSNKWLWLYADAGLVNRAAVMDGPAWAWSLKGAALPNASHAAGEYGTQSSGQINVNYGADPYLTLDPTLPLTGTNANQFVGVVANQSGVVLPLCCDVVYTPLYLEPR